MTATVLDDPQQLALPFEMWDPLYLPRYPLATDDFAAGLYRMARGKALEHRYIEANPQALSNLLVVDVDHPDAALRALSSVGSHPMPTAIVENPHNGHAHAVWALAEPVTRTEYARRKPLALAAAVTEGLRRALDGDKGYSGLITKNPIHEAWSTHWVDPKRLWSLGELSHGLGAYMPAPGWARTRRASPSGLGRNCWLFETVRTWAYPQIPEHRGDSAGFYAAIHQTADELNLTRFTTPLPTSEVRSITASIHRWITTSSELWKRTGTTLSERQAARGRLAAGKAKPDRTVTDEFRAAQSGRRRTVDVTALLAEAH